MEKDDELALEHAVDALNAVGRKAAEYLAELLKKEENEEAAGWIEVTL